MKLHTFLAIICLLLVGACKPRSVGSSYDNAVYYWRTTFELNDEERDFLAKHDVNRLYLRYFDVDTEDQYGDIIPIATVKMATEIPGGIEVIPTVYITRSAIRSHLLNENRLAQNLVKRINAISAANNISFNEIQLDCDWDNTTRNAYFRLCEEVKELLPEDCKLSSTIRLYQLAETPPPVDCGVLMVYNSGSIQDYTTENSIFSLKDIKPYLKNDRVANYDLPLDIAYPVYGWSVVFDCDADGNYNYKHLLHTTDFSDHPEIEQVDRHLFKVTVDVTAAGAGLSKGDMIRTERGNAKEIFEVKKLIEAQLKDRPHHNILYHLNAPQLSHYTDDEITEIYTRN